MAESVRPDLLPSNPVPQDDLLEAFSIPAVVINRMIANNNANGMRLSFLEEHAPGKVSPKVRAAIHLSYSEAASLRDLITDQLERAAAADWYVKPVK